MLNTARSNQQRKVQIHTVLQQIRTLHLWNEEINIWPSFLTLQYMEYIWAKSFLIQIITKDIK